MSEKKKIPVLKLVSDMEEKGFNVSDDERKVLKGIETSFNETLKSFFEGTMDKAEALDMIEKLSLDATKVTMGDGDAKKSIDEVMREWGTKITALEKTGTIAADLKIDLKNQLTALKPQLKSMWQNKGSADVEITLKVPAVMTTTNTIDFDTNTIPVEAMESMSLGAYAAKRYGKQWLASVADRVTVANMDKEFTVWDEEGDVEGAFAIVAEGALKPLLSADIVKNYAKAQKVAGKYVITEEFEKFYSRALRIIERIIRDKMIRDYEALLRAEFATVDVAYTGSALDGTFVAPNDYDAIAAAAAQIEALNFVPDTLILNPGDKWRIRTTKDNENRYVFPVVTQNGETRIFEFNIVTSTYQPVGTFTLAESGLFKIEEEAMTVRIGYGVNVTGSNPVTAVEADFDHNRKRVIVETFFKAYLPTPYIGSAVTATFDAVKADLLADQV